MKDIRLIPNSLAQGNPLLSQKILLFLLDNHLFGHDTVPQDDTLLCEAEAYSDLYTRARTFLAHCEETQEQKNVFLLSLLEEKFPVTADRISLFFEEADVSVSVRYRVMDWMVNTLQAELMEFSSEEAERIVQRMNQETTLQAVSTFCLFLGWMKQKFPNVKYRVDIIPPARRSESTAGQAYGLKTIACLYYYLFSEEGIAQEHILEKACENELAAHALAYLCTHLVSALRDTDLARLPHPVLPCPPADFLANAAGGTVPPETCSQALKAMMSRLGYLHMKPHKVQRHQGIEDIFISIPQSLEVHFGLIFLICEAHFQINHAGEDGPLFRKVTAYKQIRSCLGENVGALFLERDASPIALSKSYLQLMELEGAGNGMKALNGYMLASLARSHKGGPDGFAVTTAVYLRDFGLGIVSPETTAKAMFDRGILSCLPSMLLDLVTGGTYRTLDFSQQTMMLSELGLTPLEVESAMELFLEARARSKEALKAVFSAFSAEDSKTAAANALNRIAGYQAAGKEPDTLCLMTALGKTCQDPAGTNCILCPYRICTRATVYHAAGELHRLLRLSRQAATPGEQKKYRLLAQQCLLPAIQMTADIAAQTYGEESSRQLLSLLDDIVTSFSDKENTHEHTSP